MKMKYNIDYFFHMLKLYSSTAQGICGIRWEFVKQINAKHVLDYGSGCGFFKAFAPADVVVDNIDPMPVPQTGIKHRHYDLITFWDVLEHLPDVKDVLPVLDLTDHVAVTVPIKPDEVEWSDYKHNKPGEHLTYFTVETMTDLMKHFGFELIKCGMPECPPREHIWSFLFKKTKADRSKADGKKVNSKK